MSVPIQRIGPNMAAEGAHTQLTMGCDGLSGIFAHEMQGGCCARLVHCYGDVTYSCAGMFTHLDAGPKIVMTNSLPVMNSVLHTAGIYRH